MTDAVKAALAQIDLVVGDVAGNTAKIIDNAQRARDAVPDVGDRERRGP